jgi:hypothetical protein
MKKKMVSSSLVQTLNTHLYWIDYLDEPSFVSERSFVRAPLNSRLGPVPTTPKGKGKERALAEEEDFSMMDLDVQEAQLLEDLLNVLKVCDSPNNNTALIMCLGNRGNRYFVRR